MIGASKILTVSYGTFSCTLEGFDDPFNTMKAIAEYFRDLAAGDRYFGAEPPTPDAAMLHKIAEREIQRRVEASVQENGVILRAADSGLAQIAAPLQPPQAQPPRALAAAEDPALAAKLDRIRNAVAHHAGTTAAPAMAEQGFTAPAWTPAEPAQPQADALPEDSPQASIDMLPEDLFRPELAADADTSPQGFDGRPADSGAMDATSGPEADFGAELTSAESPAAPEPFAPELADSIPAGLMEDAAPDTGFQSPGPQADRVRARVIRIRRAPVQPAETVEALPPISATIDAMAIAPEAAETSLSPEDEADLLRELAELEAELPAQPAEAAVDGFEDDLAALDLSALDIVAEEPALAEPMAELGDSETPFVADHTDDTAAIMAADTAEADQSFEDAVLAAALADTAPGFDEAPLFAEETAFTTDDSFADDIAPAPAFDMAELEDDAEIYAPASVAPVSVAAAAANRISQPAVDDDADMDAFDAEAEAALEAALNTADLPEAALPESPALATPATQAPVTQAPAAADPVRPVRPVRRLRVARAPQHEAEAEPQRSNRDRLPVTVDPVNEEEAVKRLLAETNSQMSGADSRRRVSAIAHLKAAVAATVADRRAGASLRKSEEERVEPYREDLSRIVRPVPATGGARPAPLVLVSELRVDPRPVVTPSRPRLAEPAMGQTAAPAPAAPGTTPASPVRPRRVGSAALAPQDMIEDDEDDLEDPLAPEEARGFAEFADRLGAIGLPALLEAAAAYSACIEGRPHFSRPQLMRQVTTMAEDTGHSREDSLRSFGTLLREGRIIKVRRGQYALAEESHLLAKARKLVG